MKMTEGGTMKIEEVRLGQVIQGPSGATYRVVDVEEATDVVRAEAVSHRCDQVGMNQHRFTPEVLEQFKPYGFMFNGIEVIMDEFMDDVGRYE
jgi:hypothetical protein